MISWAFKLPTHHFCYCTEETKRSVCCYSVKSYFCDLFVPDVTGATEGRLKTDTKLSSLALPGLQENHKIVKFKTVYYSPPLSIFNQNSFFKLDRKRTLGENRAAGSTPSVLSVISLYCIYIVYPKICTVFM